ncbi:MAG: hypothetical protein V4636_11640 [Pseudomonadota bacterium]
MSVSQVPRRSSVLRKDGKVDGDWDHWFDTVRRTANAAEIQGTFANNVAALAGGLVAGQVYQTATGEVRVVV